MNTKVKILFVLLSFSFLSLRGFAQETPYAEKLDSIFQGLKGKDYSMLKPLLTEDVKLSTLPRGQNDMLVPYIIQNLPVPSSYKVEGVEKEGNATRVKTIYSYEGYPNRNLSFLFDENGQITDFDILQGIEMKNVAEVDVAYRPQKIETPFELLYNLILVKVKLNGRDVFFIFDSGAQTLTINSDAFSKDEIKNAGQLGFSVSGAVDVNEFHVDTLDWNGLLIENYDAGTMPLGKDLRAGDSTIIAGLIGYEMIKNYQVTFDYANKKLILEVTDDTGNLVDRRDKINSDEYHVVPLVMKGQNPMFKATIGGKEYNMALDCGAAVGLMYAKFIPELGDHISQMNQAHFRGAGDNSVQGQFGFIDKMIVGNVTYEQMPFSFNDRMLSGIDMGEGEPISGLLGYHFLQAHKTAINFNKKEMYIYY